MEGNSLHTKLLLPSHHDHHDHDHDHDHDDGGKGGIKTMPFIIVNEAFERVATYGLMPNMIFYLMEVYHMEAATGTTVLSVWGAVSNSLSVFGAFLSDSYLGRFRVIALGSLASLLGLTLLWLTSMFPQLKPPSCYELDSNCNSPTPTQLALLFSSFGVLSIGSGCIRPCSIAFGADQLKHDRNLNNERMIESYFNWYYASVALSTVFAFTIVVYIQDRYGWQFGFAVPVFIMVCSALMFLLGSSLYIKVEVSESPFSGFAQVLIIAFKNRKINLRSDDCYNHTNGILRVELTENLRFLNKACVIRDLNVNSSALSPCNVSTVEKVELLKSLIRIIPLWSSSIILFTTITQNFPTLQAKTMNRHVTSGFEIPAGSFNLFMVLSLTIWIVFYDRILVPLLANYTHQPRGLHPRTRMGIGLVISVGAMVVAAIVETKRRDLARSIDGLNTTNDMSAFWLVPQYALLGIAEAFNAVGQMEFFYLELPTTMSSIAMAMSMGCNAIAGLAGGLLIKVVDSITSKGGNMSWLSSDINKGHVDYYYWLLGSLNMLNFFYFLLCCRSFSPKNIRLSHEPEEEGSGCRQQNTTSEF